MLLIRIWGTLFAFALVGLVASMITVTFMDPEPKWAMNVFGFCASFIMGTIILIVACMILVGLWYGPITN